MRRTAVAGSFYSSDSGKLEKETGDWLKRAQVKVEGELVAGVVPHAGHMYSGAIAAYTFKAISQSFPKPPVFVLIGPNHTGEGAMVAVSKQDWQTPLGVAKNDEELAEVIVRKSPVLALDESAHSFEHSIEVQLPFLQTIYEQFSFVPIAMMMQDYETAREVAKAVFEAERELKRSIFVLASSDFTHYEPEASAKRKDDLALGEIKKMDAKSFVRAVEANRISICGFAPVAAALEYAKLKGARRTQVLKYGNSGDTTGDLSSVVAYCSMVFTK